MESKTDGPRATAPEKPTAREKAKAPIEAPDSGTEDASQDQSLLLQDPQERYNSAKESFDALMERDFPDFAVDQYAAEKAAAEGVEVETLSSKFLDGVRAVPSRLDVTGDGKVGLDDAAVVLGKTGEKVSHKAKEAAEKLAALGDREITDVTADIGHRAAALGDRVARAGDKVRHFDYGGALGSAAKKAKRVARSVDGDTFKHSGLTALKIGKTASGVQGLQDRREAKEIKTVSQEYVEAAEALTEQRRIELNDRIEEFGALRLQALGDTLGRFLIILEKLKQRNKEKEYELLDGLGIDTKTLDAMGALDMTVSESLRVTATTGALGVAAVLGTPALVTGAVTAFATASTGTAISTLSGAAASNAVLAWLGGGSIAAGGGGMAAGSVVLVGITAGATAGVALLSAGLLTSTHYARKLTDAKTYQKDVALGVANLENAWLTMDTVGDRVDELSDVTEELRIRTVAKLDQLEALVPTFDAKNQEDATVFNQAGRLVKTMVELAQVPLLGEQGELTEESMTMTVRVKKVLNTEV